MPEAYGRTAANPLEAQRKYEQDYQLASFPGVKLSEHDFCNSATLPHGGWIAEIPPRPGDDPPPGSIRDYRRTPFQVYVTFQVADVVLMIGSVYGDENERKAVAAKIGAICGTFVREKP